MIYLISENDEDPAFDKLDYVKRIIIEDLHENPLVGESFRNVL